MDADDPSDMLSDQTSTSSKREQTKLPCSPCFEDGNRLDDSGFCVDCDEHLCDRCLKQQSVSESIRNHQLLDKQHRPDTKQNHLYKDDTTDKCKTHRDEVIKYYCEDHKTFGCTVCVTFGHRTCNVGYIPILAVNVFNSDEYKAFNTALECLIQKTTAIQDTARINHGHAKIHTDQAVGAIRKLRKQVNAFFDDLEYKTTNEVSKIQENNQRNIDAILRQNDALAKEIQDLKLSILAKESKDQKSRLFVDIKEQRHKIDKLKIDLCTLQRKNKIRELRFKPSTSVTDFICDNSQVLGTLGSFYQTIPVDSPNDSEQDCTITDISVLAGGRLSVREFNNDCVKIVDTKHGTVITTKSTPVQSFCRLTTIADNTIAVLMNGDIEIYSVANLFKLQKMIRNTGLRWSIVYANKRFIGITSSMPPTLRMVDMNGTVIKTYPTKSNGKNLFVKPWYIALSPDHTLIYVSDWGNNTVTCLTFKGEVRARCNAGSEWDPRGVAVSHDGNVYVCDYKNGNIHVLKSDLEDNRVLLGDSYGIYKPRGLAYCDREHKLYVGMMPGKSIGVFDMRFEPVRENAI